MRDAAVILGCLFRRLISCVDWWVYFIANGVIVDCLFGTL